MLYAVVYGGEPLFISETKQSAMIFGQMLAAFYFGFDFDVQAHEAQTIIKAYNSQDSAFDIVIFRMDVNDWSHMGKLIEMNKPERLPEPPKNGRNLITRRK